MSLSLKLTRTLSASAGIPHRAGNALLYHWLEAAEPSLAQFVHNQAAPKPFTLSPLMADGDGRFRLRATLLEDQYWPYVEKGMQQERTIRVEDKILVLEGEPQVMHQTYIALAQSVATRRDIILRFDSPTSFKSREMNYPLPDPVLVFASHCARWNAFVPETLRIGEVWSDWVAQHVAVSRCELSSQVFHFGDHQQIGCMGQVQYVVVGNGPEVEEGRGPLNALADYAFFCGTGHKTTQGMGQTRRLPRWENEDSLTSNRQAANIER